METTTIFVVQVTYYTFFHPTGVQINFCCCRKKVSTEGIEPGTSHHDRPNFLDLREDKHHVATSHAKNAEDGENALGNGDVAKTEYVRTKSRLSVSRYCCQMIFLL